MPFDYFLQHLEPIVIQPHIITLHIRPSENIPHHHADAEVLGDGCREMNSAVVTVVHATS